MKPIILAIIILACACTEFDYSYDLDEYELDVPEEGVVLHVGSDPWRGEYDYRDQPEDGYCGPVALKNIMWWYETDMSWETAAEELSTNDWNPGMQLWKYCAAACMGEVIGCANACYLVVKKQVKGTTIKSIKKAIQKYAPDGYELKYTSGDPSMVDEIIYQVSQGNPVLIQETLNDSGWHLSLITGFYWQKGEIRTMGANTYDRSLDDFMKAWSTVDGGNKVERYAMAKMDAGPFTAMWFSRTGD